MSDIVKVTQELKKTSAYDKIVMYRGVLRLKKLKVVKENTDLKTWMDLFEMLLKAHISDYYLNKIKKLEGNNE